MDTRARARLVIACRRLRGQSRHAVPAGDAQQRSGPSRTRAQLSRCRISCYFAGVALARRDSVIPVEGAYLNYTLRTPSASSPTAAVQNHPLMILCKRCGRALDRLRTVVKRAIYGR